MNFGLYTSFLGMRSRQQQLDLLANNIANAATSGFKADRLLYRSLEAARQDPNASPSAAAAGADTNSTTSTENGLTRVRYGVDVGVVTTQTTDFAMGPVRETGRSLDVALNGDAFIVVQTPRGERYTRQGSLTLDASGQLVTQRGDLVVGDAGPITIPPGDVQIGEDGTISSGNQIAGRLKLVRFAQPTTALAKEGESLFMRVGNAQPEEATDTRVVQGALEMSNVNSLTEMVAMMQNSREFESMQKGISTLMNDLGRKVANELGRL